MNYLQRHLLALCVVFSDRPRAYVGSDDLRPLLAHQEQVGLYSETADRVGNVHPDADGAIVFVLYDGPTLTAAADLVRAALTCRHAERVPLTEITPA